MGDFKVLRGTKNSEDLGRVLEYNGEPDANTWDDEECDRFIGTGIENSLLFRRFN